MMYRSTALSVYEPLIPTSATIDQVNSSTGLGRISYNKGNEDTYIFDDSAGEGIIAYVADVILTR